MANIGNYEAPQFKFSTILKGTEKLVEILKGSVADEKNFITALGYKSKNGAYLTRVSDMRKYGLLSDRGISATDLANRIIKPLTQKEKRDAINESINNISLWRELMRRIGKKDVDEEDFRLQLSEITGDRDKAYKSANSIFVLYRDILQHYYEKLPKNTEKYMSNKKEENMVGDESVDSQTQIGEEKILLRFKDSNVLLDKNDANIDILKSILDGLKENQEKVNRDRS